MVAHPTTPVEEVVRAFEPEQLWRVATDSPPPVIAIPPAKVEVAEVEVTAKVPVDNPPRMEEVAVVEVAEI